MKSIITCDLCCALKQSHRDEKAPEAAEDELAKAPVPTGAIVGLGGAMLDLIAEADDALAA